MSVSLAEKPDTTVSRRQGRYRCNESHPRPNIHNQDQEMTGRYECKIQHRVPADYAENARPTNPAMGPSDELGFKYNDNKNCDVYEDGEVGQYEGSRSVRKCSPKKRERHNWVIVKTRLLAVRHI